MQKIKKVEYVLQGGQRLGRKKHHLTCPNHTSESVRSGQQQQHHPQDMEDLTPKRQPSTTKPSGPLVRTIHSPPHPRSPSPLLSSAPAPASASQPASQPSPSGRPRAIGPSRARDGRRKSRQPCFVMASRRLACCSRSLLLFALSCVLDDH